MHKSSPPRFCTQTLGFAHAPAHARSNIYGKIAPIYSIYFTKTHKIAPIRQKSAPTFFLFCNFSLRPFQCNFGLILCKTSSKMHKDKKICISVFSKKPTNSTNIANNLTFVCQICNFSQPCFGGIVLENSGVGVPPSRHSEGTR